MHKWFESQTTVTLCRTGILLKWGRDTKVGNTVVTAYFGVHTLFYILSAARKGLVNKMIVSIWTQMKINTSAKILQFWCGNVK